MSVSLQSAAARYLDTLRANYDPVSVVPSLHPVWKLHASFPFDRMRDDMRQSACAVLMDEALDEGLSPALTRSFRLSVERYPEGPMASILSGRGQDIDSFLGLCHARYLERQNSLNAA